MKSIMTTKGVMPRKRLLPRNYKRAPGRNHRQKFPMHVETKKKKTLSLVAKYFNAAEPSSMWIKLGFLYLWARRRHRRRLRRVRITHGKSSLEFFTKHSKKKFKAPIRNHDQPVQPARNELRLNEPENGSTGN